MTGLPYRIDPAIVRDYDVRGVFGRSLRPEDAFVIGWAFAIDLAERSDGPPPRVCLGYDGRLSSPLLEAAMADGLVAAGADVVRIGLGPTPMLSHACLAMQAAGGVMITGSHNPATHNGFKLVRHGRGLSGDDLRALVHRAEQGWTGPARAGRSCFVSGQQSYADHLRHAIPRGLDGLSVVWDPGHGACAAILPLLLPFLPGRHKVINGTVDGHFPDHHPDPSEDANLRSLANTVLSERADLGLAFDGDGDRLGVVDGRGRIVRSDQVLALLAEDVLATHPGGVVVADVKTSQGLFDQVAALGGRAVMAAAGRGYIRRTMIELGACLGGEMSGHLFFADRHPGYDDALYAALRLLAVLGQGEDELGRRVDALPRWLNTPEIRVPCDDARKDQVVALVAAALGQEGAAIDRTDGLRVTTADGWWLLRASKTQGALSLRCEAPNQAGLERVKGHLMAYLSAVDIVVPWR